MTQNETIFTPAIKYVRPFDPDKLKEYVWKQSENNEYTTASAPCFSGTPVEELLYCEDHFRDAMTQLGKTEEVWFEQWKSLLHGLAKDIWLEVLEDETPKTMDNPSIWRMKVASSKQWNNTPYSFAQRRTQKPAS